MKIKTSILMLRQFLDNLFNIIMQYLGRKPPIDKADIILIYVTEPWSSGQYENTFRQARSLNKPVIFMVLKGIYLPGFAYKNADGVFTYTDDNWEEVHEQALVKVRELLSQSKPNNT